MRCCSILKSSLLKKIGNSADKQTYWGMQGRLRSTERSRAKQTLTTNASRKLRKTQGAKRANAWLLLRFTTHTHTPSVARFVLQRVFLRFLKSHFIATAVFLSKEREVCTDTQYFLCNDTNSKRFESEVDFLR
jgi:hypothetical protein